MLIVTSLTFLTLIGSLSSFTLSERSLFIYHEAETNIILDKYRNTSVIINLTLFNCDFYTGFLTGLKINLLKINCSNRIISKHLLEGIFEGPHSIIFYNAEFNLIPLLYGSRSVRQLSIINSKISRINIELQNYRELSHLTITHSLLEIISAAAFQHMNIIHLNLSSNRLSFLDANLFTPLTDLEMIDLSGNMLINVNFNLPHIQIILLNNNEFKSVSGLFLKPMWSVQFLDLSSNPIGNISVETFRKKISGIQKLLLRNCSLYDISKKAFYQMKQLRYLDISDNFLVNFNPKAFSRRLENMRILKMRNNRLTLIENYFFYLPKLEELQLNMNNISTLGKIFQNISYLRILNLNNNMISSLNENYFYNVSILEELMLKNNKIHRLDSECFSSLSQLRKLFLSSNQISNLNQSLRSLKRLEILMLDGNPLESLDEKEMIGMINLQFLFLNKTKLKEIGQVYKHKEYLNYLNLGYNNLTTFYLSESIQISRIILEGNLWKCDCRLNWILDKIQDIYSNPICNSPEWLNGKHFRELTKDDLIDWPINCPYPCKCSCLPTSSNYVIHVDCSKTNLTVIPDYLPDRIHQLDLSNNNIEVLDSIACKSIENITSVNLEDNRITTVLAKCIQNHTIFKLARNLLKTIYLNQKTESYLQNISLSENPWECNCKTIMFRKWLLSHQKIISDINEIRCGLSTRRELSFKPIIILSEKDLCFKEITYVFFIVFGILGFLLLVSSLKILYSHYRMNIKIWLYSKGVMWVKEEDLNQRKQFDAFVSFSSFDEDFVIHSLVPGLEEEEPKYSLCLHYRNFSIGEFIYDNILNAVECSCRVIIVLSRNFLTSEWCKLEFRTAHHQVLQDKVNRLIVIKYGDLPPLENIDQTIRVYLESTTYLTWGEKCFWQKLRYALPKKRIGRNSIVNL